MIFTPFDVAEDLAPYINNIFHYKEYMPEHEIERVVPTGEIHLIFELDDIPRHTYSKESLQVEGTFTKCWVSGMHDQYLSISAHPKSEMLIVIFKPSGAFPFFKSQLSDLTNKVISASEIFGNDCYQLRDKIKDEGTTRGKLDIIVEWLRNQFDESLIVDKEITNMVTLFKNEPYAQHKEVIEGYSKSQKTLIKSFRKYIGLSPKKLHRIFRFNALLNRINEQKEIKWTDVVYETGYSDQSHFIKEFAEFSGFNPTGFIKNEYHKQIPNFFPLKE